MKQCAWRSAVSMTQFSRRRTNFSQWIRIYNQWIRNYNQCIKLSQLPIEQARQLTIEHIESTILLCVISRFVRRMRNNVLHASTRRLTEISHSLSSSEITQLKSLVPRVHIQLSTSPHPFHPQLPCPIHRIQATVSIITNNNLRRPMTLEQQSHQTRHFECSLFSRLSTLLQLLFLCNRISLGPHPLHHYLPRFMPTTLRPHASNRFGLLPISHITTPSSSHVKLRFSRIFFLQSPRTCSQVPRSKYLEQSGKMMSPKETQ